MSEYVSKVLLEVNGKQVDDFNKITEPDVEYRGEVKLMNKTGFTSKTPRYSPIKVEYVVPKDGPEFDFSSIQDGTLTIDYDNGTRRTYTGVSCLKVGGESYGEDGKETIRNIELMATDRDPK